MFISQKLKQFLQLIQVGYKAEELFKNTNFQVSKCKSWRSEFTPTNCCNKPMTYTVFSETIVFGWFLEAEVEKTSDQPSKEEESRTNELLKQMEKVDREISEVERKIDDLKEKQVCSLCLNGKMAVQCVSLLK